LKLQETLRATAFKEHTYKHTTMGFIKDIEDMPNQFDYSWEFFRRYYRPEYTTILVVGDVKRDEVVEMVRANFGAWERGNYKPEIPREPEQSEPRTAHVDWATPTLPYVTVAFHNPAYSDEQKDYAALDLLSRSRLAKTPSSTRSSCSKSRRSTRSAHRIRSAWIHICSRSPRA
jgi:zinc protease